MCVYVVIYSINNKIRKIIYKAYSFYLKVNIIASQTVSYNWILDYLISGRNNTVMDPGTISGAIRLDYFVCLIATLIGLFVL